MSLELQSQQKPSACTCIHLWCGMSHLLFLVRCNFLCSTVHCFLNMLCMRLSMHSVRYSRRQDKVLFSRRRSHCLDVERKNRLRTQCSSMCLPQTKHRRGRWQRQEHTSFLRWRLGRRRSFSLSIGTQNSKFSSVEAVETCPESYTGSALTTSVVRNPQLYDSRMLCLQFFSMTGSKTYVIKRWCWRKMHRDRYFWARVIWMLELQTTRCRVRLAWTSVYWAVGGMLSCWFKMVELHSMFQEEFRQADYSLAIGSLLLDIRRCVYNWNWTLLEVRRKHLNLNESYIIFPLYIIWGSVGQEASCILETMTNTFSAASLRVRNVRQVPSLQREIQVMFSVCDKETPLVARLVAASREATL